MRAIARDFLENESCSTVRVERILLVIRGALDHAALERCCGPAIPDQVEIAIGYELPAGRDSLEDTLAVQRRLTAMLRELRGARAEMIPVFAICDRSGERLEDYATAWGATEVRG